MAPRRIATAIRIALAAVLIMASGNNAPAQLLALPGTFNVSPTGAATYTIPIVVPPGTAGLAPSLSLDYNSQGGNGVVGMGWSVSGLTSITRCPRTVAQDGVRGGINFDGNDRFCLRGQRLVVINGGTYGADGSEYRTEVESFSKILAHGTAGTGPAWFEVHTKGGQVLQFGNTPDSQILVPGSLTVRAWAENRVTDAAGNYFTVTYSGNPTGSTNPSTTPSGQAYPVQINYTGNTATGLQPYNSVQFVYATRTDVVPQYQHGALLQSTVLLTDVKTFAGSALISDYHLGYQTSPSTQRSRLSVVTLCGGDGACLQPTTLTWTDIGLSFLPASTFVSGFGTAAGFTDNNTFPRFLADVDGDGLPDIVAFGGAGVSVAASASRYQVSRWFTGLGTGSGFTNENTFPRFLVDMNGDGLADIVPFASGGVSVKTSTGSAFAAPAVPLTVNTFGTGAGFTDENTFPRFLADVNGDGLPDIVAFGSASVSVALNSPSGFAAPTKWISSFGTNNGFTNENTFPRLLVDMNGDGFADLVAFQAAGVTVDLSDGQGSFVPVGWSVAQFTTNAGGWTDNNTFPRFLADVNGDGLPDIVGFSASGVFVSLNTGTGFTPPVQWVDGFGTNAGFSDNNTFPRFLVDVNGDGMADIVAFGANGVLVSLSTGSGFTQATQWVAGFGTANGFTNNTTFPRFVVDVTGDGRPDIVGFGSNAVFLAQANSNTSSAPNIITPGSLSESGRPDLLRTIANGLGATTTVTFGSLVANSSAAVIPAINPTTYAKDHDAVFPTQDFIGPLPVVSRVDTQWAAGSGVGTWTYSYVGAKVDLSGRGFLGFRQVIATDRLNNVAQTTSYRQDFPFLGLVASQTKTAVTPTGTVTLSESTNTYSATNLGGRSFVALTQSVVTGNDLNGAALPTVNTLYQYDNATTDPTEIFGNPTTITVSASDGATKTTTNTYTNDTVNWHLGRLTQTTVTGNSTP